MHHAMAIHPTCTVAAGASWQPPQTICPALPRGARPLPTSMPVSVAFMAKQVILMAGGGAGAGTGTTTTGVGFGPFGQVGSVPAGLSTVQQVLRSAAVGRGPAREWWVN